MREAIAVSAHSTRGRVVVRLSVDFRSPPLLLKTLRERTLENDETILSMVDDTGVLQARMLLSALYEEVENISCKLEVVEHHRPKKSARAALDDRQRSTRLRKKLYEAHGLIDGIHRRFPETLRSPDAVGMVQQVS